MTMPFKSRGQIANMNDLRAAQLQSKTRILDKERELRQRVQQVPGELFYSGVDSVIPSFLSGKVSSFALNAGKGLINNFFVRKAVTSGSLGILKYAKPSGFLKKIGSVVKSVTSRRKKLGSTPRAGK